MSDGLGRLRPTRHGRYRPGRPYSEAEIGRSDLAKLTFGKGAVNTALRWLPFFLPTLTIAFDSSTTTLALLLGVAEAAGLSTLFVGRWLDAGQERRVMIASFGGVVISAGLALIGSIGFFAVAAVVLGGSSALMTVAGHAWISARVPFNRRARFIGVYEISWASALLIGVPVIALLISAFGWRGPFIFVAIVALVAAVLIATIDDGVGVGVGVGETTPEPRVPITKDAWLIIGVGAAIAMAGLTMLVVAGTWLSEALGVSTGGVGLFAMAFGVAELAASTSSSAFADRLGKGRSMLVSMTCVVIGLGIILAAGSSLVVGATGFFVFFIAFEYSIVTSFSLVSEAMPTARGSALAVGSATSTLARGSGSAAAGALYAAFEITGPAVLSGCAAVFGLALLAVVVRRRPDLA